MSFFSFLSPSLIGIDIEPSLLKLIQLKKRRRGWIVEQMVYQALPDDIFVEYKIKDWTKLCMILTDIVQALGLKGSLAAIHLPSHLVRMHSIRLAKSLLAADIEAEIYTHVQKELPGINEGLCIDYTEMAQHEAHSEVFFAAAKEAYLSQYIDCINTAGFITKIVDVDIYALKRSICFAKGFINQSLIQVVLYATADVATLFAFNADDILFHQQWDLVSQEFTVSFKNHLQICLAKVNAIDQFVICIGKLYADILLDECFKNLPIYHPKPFNKLSLGPDVNAAWVMEHAQEFFIALGLAMREVPRW